MFQTLWSKRTDGVFISKFKRNMIWQAWDIQWNFIATDDKKRRLTIVFLSVFVWKVMKKNNTISRRFIAYTVHTLLSISCCIVYKILILIFCERIFRTINVSWDKVMALYKRLSSLQAYQNDNKSFFVRGCGCLKFTLLLLLLLLWCCTNGCANFGFNLLKL